MTETFFRQRVASVMVDNKYDRRVRGKDTGKLDMKRLPKVAIGSNKVFTKKEARKGKNYNIVLLIDCSGSMEGMEYYNYGPHSERRYAIEVASECAVALYRNFGKLGVECAIVGFSDRAAVLRGFDAGRGVNEEKLRGDIISYGWQGTRTDRGLELGYSLFRNRPGENLLVVITDGEADGIARGVIPKLIKQNHRVKTMGIGVGIDVRETVSGCVVNDIEELYPNFLSLISNEIKRH
jgi:Mg-chelatase subunit ChlD